MIASPSEWDKASERSSASWVKCQKLLEAYQNDSLLSWIFPRL